MELGQTILQKTMGVHWNFRRLHQRRAQQLLTISSSTPVWVSKVHFPSRKRAEIQWGHIVPRASQVWLRHLNRHINSLGPPDAHFRGILQLEVYLGVGCASKCHSKPVVCAWPVSDSLFYASSFGECWLLRLAHKRHCDFHFALSYATHCGESWTPCHQNTQAPTLKQLYGMAHFQGTEAFCRQPAPHASRVSAPSWMKQILHQAFRRAQPWPTSWLHESPWTTQLSHPWIHDSQKTVT